MGASRSYLTILCLFVITFLAVCMVVTPFYFERDNLEHNSLESSESTSYDFPEEMYDDVANYEYWSNGGSFVYYYYRTQSASPSYYHVIWFQPTDPADIFQLLVYENNINGDYVVSTWEEGYDWVVIRPSHSMDLFGVVKKPPTISGYAYIEWEDSSVELTPGNFLATSLGGSEKIELYSVPLSQSLTYTINLTVPPTGDFDVYLYFFGSGQAEPGEDYLVAAETVGNGVDETIANFNPSASGDYALLVVRRSGSGTYNLTLSEHQTNPSEVPINFSFIYLGIIIVILFVFHTRKNQSRYPCL